MSKPLVIATRKSPLALWQANFIRQQLQTLMPTTTIEILGFTTQGDKLLDAPLAKIGGKGLFVKELELALLEQRADIAVHSMKDVPAILPTGLTLAAFCKRDDPRDALISAKGFSLATLPNNARIGTASLRRQCLLLAQRPDLQISSLRGNVNSRLAKLDTGEFDAILLASAGLDRLSLTARPSERISTDLLLPAIGQGVLGLECRTTDLELQKQLHTLHDAETAHCLIAERAVGLHLGASCQVPLGAHATLSHHQCDLRGFVGTPDGKTILRAEATGPMNSAAQLGKTVADTLLNQGAGEILASFGIEIKD